MRRGNRPEVDTVEGDQGQEGYVLVRTTSDSDREGEVTLSGGYGRNTFEKVLKCNPRPLT